MEWGPRCIPHSGSAPAPTLSSAASQVLSSGTRTHLCPSGPPSPGQSRLLLPLSQPGWLSFSQELGPKRTNFPDSCHKSSGKVDAVPSLWELPFRWKEREKHPNK